MYRYILLSNTHSLKVRAYTKYEIFQTSCIPQDEWGRYLEHNPKCIYWMSDVDYRKRRPTEEELEEPIIIYNGKGQSIYTIRPSLMLTRNEDDLPPEQGNDLIIVKKKTIHVKHQNTRAFEAYIRKYARLPKKYLTPPGTTVRDLIDIPFLAQRLPYGAEFDLDRPVPGEFVVKPDSGHMYVDFSLDEDGDSKFESYRWVRLCLGSSPFVDNVMEYWPLNEELPDKALVFFPIRKQGDKYARNYLDDYYLTLEIVHTKKYKR